MTEKTHHVSEKKKKIAENIQKLILEYPIIAAVNMENLPTRQLQQMKSQLRDKIEMTMSKRRIIKHAIEGIKGKKKNIEKLEQHLKGMPALIFTKENPFSLFKTLKKSKTSAPAKPGQTAPFDIKIPKGPTPFAPGPVIGELAQLGIKSGVEGGKVVIKEDSIIVKEGEKIPPKAAEILTRLDIKPMEVGLNVTAVYENGDIFTKEILDIDEEEFIADLQKAASGSLNLAINIEYPTKETINILIGKAFNDAKALGLSAEIIEEGIIEGLLSKAESSALSLKSTAKIEAVEKPKEEKVEAKKEEPKAEEKKPEPKKEEKPKEAPKVEEKKPEPKKEEPKVEIKEVPAPEIKEEPTPTERKEEKILEEEKEIIKEEEKLEKEVEKTKIETPVEKEVEKEIKEEEEKQLEEERIRKEKELEKIEEQKKAEEEARRKEEERKAEEKKRLEEEQRKKQEEGKRTEEEKKRQEEEQRKAEEEARRKEEEKKKLEEEKRKAEEEAKKKEEERKRQEEARIKEEEEEKRRLEEEQRKKQEEERKRTEEEAKKQKPQDETDKRIAEMVAKTKKFVKGEIPDAEKLVEEAGKLAAKEVKKEVPKEKPKEAPKIVEIKEAPKVQEKIPSIQELRERKEKQEKNIEKKKKEQEEVEDLAQELIKKGTLRK